MVISLVPLRPTFRDHLRVLLRILKLTSDSTFPHHLNNNNVASFNLERSTIEGCSDTELYVKETSSATSAYEAIQGGARTAKETSSINEIVLQKET